MDLAYKQKDIRESNNAKMNEIRSLLYLLQKKAELIAEQTEKNGHYTCDLSEMIKSLKEI